MKYVLVSGLTTSLKLHAWTLRATCRNMSGPMHLPCLCYCNGDTSHTCPPCHHVLSYQSQRLVFNLKDTYIYEIGLCVQIIRTIIGSMWLMYMIMWWAQKSSRRLWMIYHTSSKYQEESGYIWFSFGFAYHLVIRACLHCNNDYMNDHESGSPIIEFSCWFEMWLVVPFISHKVIQHQSDQVREWMEKWHGILHQL